MPQQVRPAPPQPPAAARRAEGALLQPPLRHPRGDRRRRRRGRRDRGRRSPVAAATTPRRPRRPPRPKPTRPSPAPRSRSPPRASRSRCRPAGPTAATPLDGPRPRRRRRDDGRPEGRHDRLRQGRRRPPRTRRCCPTTCAPRDAAREARPADLGDGVQALHYERPRDRRARPPRCSRSRPPRASRRSPASRDAETCTTIASSMQITEGKAFPVGPSKAYAGDVERTLGRLEKQEKSAASALNKAGKRTSQVAATSKLASAYTGAASSLGKLDDQPGRHAAQRAARRRAARPPAAPTRRPRPRASSKDRAGYKREGAKALAAGKDMTRRARRPEDRRLHAARERWPAAPRRSPSCRR